MAFVGLPCDELPANQPKSARPYVPGVGPGTAQYGGVWPNEWPNGQRHGDIERSCVAPVTIETATGASGGRACRCRRAQRTRSTAAADGVSSLRVVDASLPRRMIAASPRQPITRAISRSRSGVTARACRSWRPRALQAPDERTRCRPTGLRARPRAWRQATAPVVEAAVSTWAPARRLEASAAAAQRACQPEAKSEPLLGIES